MKAFARPIELVLDRGTLEALDNVALAAADNGVSQRASASAPVHAEMMPWARYERLEGQGHDYLNNPRRMVWAVSVHAPYKEEVGVGIRTYPVYTMVIDAETGQSFRFTSQDVGERG